MVTALFEHRHNPLNVLFDGEIGEALIVRESEHISVVFLQRINASPISPSEKHIERIMAVLKESVTIPYISICAYGRDRTSLVAALYKVYYLGMSPQDALRYMDESGYKNSWVRGG